MSGMRRSNLLVLWAAILISPALASGQTPRPTIVPAGAGGQGRVAGCAGSQAHDLYRFCFDGTKWNIDEPTNNRFTNRDRVEVEVQHFNFLRYTLSFDIKEEKSESYQYLTKLWTSVLSPDIAGLIGGLGLEEPRNDQERKKNSAEAVLFHNIRELLRRTDALDRKITLVGEPYRKTGLTDAEAKTLSDAVGQEPAGQIPDNDNDPRKCQKDWSASSPTDPLLACSVRQVVAAVDEAYATLQRGVTTDDYQFAASVGRAAGVYRGAKDAEASIRDRADKFLALAQKTTDMELKQVGKREVGTRISLTLTAVDAGGARTPMGDVNYFVETAMPLVVHGGLAFSNLHDVTFEKIRRAGSFGEDDLFQKKSDASNSKNFSIFFGWQLAQLDPGKSPNESRASLLVSLGTDIATPGQKIFAGPSLLLFNRFVVTSGWAFAKEAHGEQQTLEPDIFKVVKQKPASSWFFSFASKVH